MEASIQDAIRYLQTHPNAKKAVVARNFGISRGKLYNRMKGHGGPYRPPAANLKIKPNEEKAICSYIDRLDQAHLAVRADFIGDVANRILREKADPADPNPPPTVGQRWVSRFSKRHGYSQRVQKKSSLRGRAVDEDIVIAQKQFEDLRELIEAEGIIPGDIWIMVEAVTGFRARVTSNQLIVTKRPQNATFKPRILPQEEPEEVKNQERSLTPEMAPAPDSDVDVSPGNHLPASPVPQPPVPATTQATTQETSQATAPVSTLRRIHEAGNEIEKALAEAQDLDPQLARAVGRFIKTSIISATKLLRAGSHMGRHRSSGRIQKQRHPAHNNPPARVNGDGAPAEIEDHSMARQPEED